MPHGDKGQGNEFAKALAVLSQIGISIIACIGVGIFLGWLLDSLLGTSPWLLLVFTLLGIAAAFKSIFDFAKKMK
ncbi:MAG: AtpZ/AtpI family protein [Oscillospiraceae bacterium]|nr:AtpZ/AtpI family protein [Oscillospiraceae bacterium]